MWKISKERREKNGFILMKFKYKSVSGHGFKKEIQRKVKEWAFNIQNITRGG